MNYDDDIEEEECPTTNLQLFSETHPSPIRRTVNHLVNTTSGAGRVLMSVVDGDGVVHEVLKNGSMLRQPCGKCSTVALKCVEREAKKSIYVCRTCNVPVCFKEHLMDGGLCFSSHCRRATTSTDATPIVMNPGVRTRSAFFFRNNNNNR